MCTQKCRREHRRRNYNSFTFNEFLLSLSGTTASDRASSSSCSPADGGIWDRRRDTVPTEHLILLLPLCKACASPRKCISDFHESTSLPISTQGSFNNKADLANPTHLEEVALDRTSEGCTGNTPTTSRPAPTGRVHRSTSAAAASASKTRGQLLECPCEICVASFLAFLLLRVALSILQQYDGQCGVFFCQREDLLENPQYKVNPFVFLLQRLLYDEIHFPWSRILNPLVSEGGSVIHEGTTRRQSPSDSLNTTEPRSLSRFKREFHALSRLAYKILDGRSDAQLNDRTREQGGNSPDLIRYLAELPFALSNPPKLVLCLQPSRSLSYNVSSARLLQLSHQEGPVCPKTLQGSANVNSYSLFVALLLRTLNAAAAASKISGASEAARGVVVEAIQSCVCCCCLNSRPGATATLPMRNSIAALCCLEEDDWLWTLRGRFTRVILLYRSNCSDRGTDDVEKNNSAFSDDILCVDITKPNAVPI